MAQKTAGGPFRFRVSDSVDVPLRGRMLRLRVIGGELDVIIAGDGDERASPVDIGWFASGPVTDRDEG